MRPVLFSLLAFVVGCDSASKFDLAQIEGKVTPGMTELQVTQAIGAPSRIIRKDDNRELRYESKDGKGAIVVHEKGNRVYDVTRED